MKNKKMIFFLCGSVIIIMLVCVIVFSKMIQYMNQQNDDALHEVGELYMKEMSNQISFYLRNGFAFIHAEGNYYEDTT